MRAFFVLLLIVILIGLVLLTTQEANLSQWIPLQLPFVDTTLQSPLLGWIGGSLGVGFLLGYLLALPGRIGAASRARKAEKQLAKVESSRSEAAEARRQASTGRAAEAPAEADEMQRLADEVARRTATVQRNPPPPAP